MDDVAAELHRCVDRALDGSVVEAIEATRRARELLAWLEGRAVDLARAEGRPWKRLAPVPWPDPPDAA